MPRIAVARGALIDICKRNKPIYVELNLKLPTNQSTSLIDQQLPREVIGIYSLVETGFLLQAHKIATINKHALATPLAFAFFFIK